MNRFRTNDEQRPIQIKQRRCSANPDTENLSMSIQQQSSLRLEWFWPVIRIGAVLLNPVDVDMFVFTGTL